ncbi:unnamed protein product (macronuclear) [Paramecium tetraurelia]|uniref:Chromosome undetermined scaffold_1, whole genome shotgun sequence n=1 Tax=Paramecium tetraurelia TaxID=5888 RepID=Q6BFE4_PARTE|nr:Myb-related protein [Paramecium tetraurelia strain d4-2]XP_001423006.1 uncharacterized protein GSPATT00000043001 [Paramecium tetraurelia]CAH03627.1 Myb-related protein, putative [Paramecium tetraurelia]CAK55608.1 unnamed protein product [Paramecium tetraurelia]|eukprot:XP_001423006.1 hypothetical protein (macronuclear) [Paramecium tetraurelia strain d4-2]
MSDGVGFFFDFYQDFQSCELELNQNQILDQNFEYQFCYDHSKEMIEFQLQNLQIENQQQEEQLSFSKNLYELQSCDSSSEEENSKQQYQNFEQLNQSRSRSREIEKKEGKLKKWTQLESDLLTNYYNQFNGNWDRIAEQMKGRTIIQCKQYWHRKHKDEDQKKSKWTFEEDQIIKDNINQYENNWAAIAKILKSKTGKQIRERYINKLRADIVDSKKQPWTPQEDLKLIQLFHQFGSKWSSIARQFYGRSDLQVRNRTRKLLKDDIPQYPKSVEDQKLKIQVQLENDFDAFNDIGSTCGKPQNKIKFSFDQSNSSTFSFNQTKLD